MGSQRVILVDPDRQIIAAAQVAEQEGRFTGIIDMSAMPAMLREQFARYEEIVENQTFALLDDVGGEIEAPGLRIIFQDGREVIPADLQIYPGTSSLSFTCGT